ncbi:hypothetical protein RchiOBHm_Chr3g0463041 [Rosa chinensis]|uniref:Uncharacterized protein n=1 Tax=Rosa chinensis TaxID=74649 RepID=A0A2P6R934_ROSCH|nr:hypothetical protein RchiOBHm_Chr3g0463041 [Rosa chinensis]
MLILKLSWYQEPWPVTVEPRRCSDRSSGVRSSFRCSFLRQFQLSLVFLLVSFHSSRSIVDLVVVLHHRSFGFLS